MARWFMVPGLIFLLTAQFSCALRDNQVRLKEMPVQTVLMIKTKTSMKNVSQELGRLYERLYFKINQMGVAPTGSPMALYYSSPGFEIELAACVPVPDGVRGGGDIEAVELTGGEMASYMFYGPYERIEIAYGVLYTWIRENGYRSEVPFREIYLAGPGTESDPEKYRTEILWPVSR